MHLNYTGIMYLAVFKVLLYLGMKDVIQIPSTCSDSIGRINEGKLDS